MDQDFFKNMKKIFLNLIQRIRNFISWLWNQEGSPSKRALGLGVGIFSGCFPFFGLQTLMGVFLAKILKGNTISLEDSCYKHTHQGLQTKEWKATTKYPHAKP